MKIGNWQSSDSVLIVAEIGNNHEGDFEVAKEMLHAAAETGVDAVKYQTFKAEHYVGISNTKRYEQIKSYELTYDQFAQLAELSSSLDVMFISTPFDLESAEFLSSIVTAFKISSSDNTFYPLLESVVGSNKPIIVSTGMLDTAQIRVTVDFIQSKMKNGVLKDCLAILHCVTSYPVPEEQANLLAIKGLRNEFDLTVGYSDHTLGIEAAAASVALGARIIEKHFTIDKNFSDFRDHQISADPEEMKALVDRVKMLDRLLGDGEKVAQLGELEIEPMVRRSIVAKVNLPKGHCLELKDITWVRPGGGVPPGDEDLVINKTLIQDIGAGELILDTMVN